MTIERLRRQAADCRNCDLWQNATQTVFGEGAAHARLMLVGEQPGDQEDKAGRPFVGPAGRILDEALERAGIDRATVYVTNAVKHFRFEMRGKRRIHKKPNTGQIRACHPWLEEEIAEVDPDLIVCLGATAAQSLLGPQFRLTQHRGEVFDTGDMPPVTATVHPSSILRSRDETTRDQEMEQFVEDLRRATLGFASTDQGHRERNHVEQEAAGQGHVDAGRPRGGRARGRRAAG